MTTTTPDAAAPTPTPTPTPTQLVRRIPMFRWRMLATRYEVPFGQIAQDEIVMMFITANEIHRAQDPAARDDLGRFEAMTMEELTDYINAHTPTTAPDADQEDGDPDDKSGQ